MCRVIKSNKSVTYALMSATNGYHQSRGLEIRKVTPVAGFEVETVRRREQVDSETKCAKVRYPINPQLRGAGWSAHSLPD